MFLRKYLNDFYLDLLLEEYELEYLRELDETNFAQVYDFFKSLGFYFLDDIILKYLEIFTLDIEIVNEGILDLEAKLGDKFVYLIGNDMRCLQTIIDRMDSAK